MFAAGAGAAPVESMPGSAGTSAAVDRPQAGDAAPPAGSDAPAQPSALAVSALQFEVLTKTLGGKYSPKNIGAIWIENGSGAFVKTLEVWAAKRERYLTRFRAEAQANRIDAVTSATLRSHVSHSVSWDLTNASGQFVAAGDYKVVVEITDHDGTGDSAVIPFTLGDPLSSTPTDAPHFVSMKLTVQ